MKISRFRIISLVPLITLVFLLAGVLAPLVAVADPWRHRVWFTGLVLTGAPVAWQTLRGMMRGQFAADVVAMLAIVGAILLQQPLAGLVVVLMQTGGEALDAYAIARASDAVAALEADAPRAAHRVEGQRIVEITVDAIVPGDLLLVRPGELVPADGVVIDGRSHVDTARLTGEPLPRRVAPGATLQSGSVNQEGAIRLRATRPAGESQYARIVELVRRAQASKSPLQRTADRWAVWFTPLTLGVCAFAWLLSHDWTRVLAVLVVATPCPLILAAPVAIIGGINRAARRSIIISSGGALEGLARVNTTVFDKTGTLTVGMPAVADILLSPGADPAQTLGQVGAVEQGSGHLLGRVLIREAELRGAPVLAAEDLVETPGRGVHGTVNGISVAVGSTTYVRERFAQSPAPLAAMNALDDRQDGLRAWALTSAGTAVRIDFADVLRPDILTMFRELEALGLGETTLLSGDRHANVQAIAQEVGIARFAGDLSPEDKVQRVAALETEGRRVLMVGDGTNDAPALSTATVGIAFAGHGGGVVAEAADVVLLVDDPMRVPEAVRIGRRSLAIARESIAVGLGLSLIAMGFAAAGLLSPVYGALTQEAIDVAVILNALRAAGEP